MAGSAADGSAVPDATGSTALAPSAPPDPAESITEVDAAEAYNRAAQEWRESQGWWHPGLDEPYMGGVDEAGIGGATHTVPAEGGRTVGTYVDLTDYEGLRVDGLRVEARRRGFRSLSTRAPLLRAVFQHAEAAVADSEAESPRVSDRPARLSPRRARSVGVSVDRRDFPRMHVRELSIEAMQRGLRYHAPRSEMVASIMRDQEGRGITIDDYAASWDQALRRATVEDRASSSSGVVRG
jgi:hypothetical protein